MPRGGAVWLARMAHNHQVVGSNPTPATKITNLSSDRFFILASVAEPKPATVFSVIGKKSRRFGEVIEVKEGSVGIFFHE